MTMQTTSLPFQVSGANAPGQAQRNQAGATDKDGGAFGATLSREIAQRQQAMAPTLAPTAAPTLAPASAPASAAPASAASGSRPAAPAKQPAGDKQHAAHKAQAADKPAAQAAKSAARDSGKADAASAAPTTAAAVAAALGTPDTAEAADALRDALATAAATTPATVAVDAAKADAATAAADSAIAAAEAATTPVTDMLAFMASLTQPQAAVPLVAAPSPAPVAAPAPAPVATLPAAAATDPQATALQSAFAKLGAPSDPAQPAATAQGDAASAGFQLAAGTQPTMLDSAEQRAPQPAAQASVQPDAGKLAPQSRDTAAPAVAAAEAPAPAPALTQLQAQVSKLETMANPAAVPGDRIPARVGTQAWDNQVSQRIVYMVGKEQAATLTLNPPDLGPVQVVLNVSNDGASVAFSSNQQEVRQALENAIPRLREMMSESGIALGNATVDAGMPDGRQAQQEGERGHGGRGGFGNGQATAAANDEAAARPATRSVALGDNGMVDTFA